MEENCSGHSQFLIIMINKKELREDLRQRNVRAHSQRKGYKAISKSIINKHKRFTTVKNLNGRGRKGKVSLKLARKNLPRGQQPRTTTKALIETLDQAGTKLSMSTIERVLYIQGLRGRRPRKTPLLRKEHLEARLTFARGHLKQDPSFCSTIMWSDATKLELFGYMDAEYVWRKNWEPFKPKNHVPTVKHGG